MNPHCKINLLKWISNFAMTLNFSLTVFVDFVDFLDWYLGFKETIFSPLNGWEWKRCLFLSGQPRLYSQHLLMDGITKCLTIPWYVSLYLHHRCHTLSNSHTSLLQFLSLVVCAGEGQGNCCWPKFGFCWTRSCQCRNLRIGFKSVQWMPQQCFF